MPHLFCFVINYSILLFHFLTFSPYDECRQLLFADRPACDAYFTAGTFPLPSLRSGCQGNRKDGNMKAVVIYEPGGPEKLIYTEVPMPGVRPGWSLVRVRGFGINHSEIFTRKGLSPSVVFPRILGIECTGEVFLSTDPERIPNGTRIISIMGEMGRAFDGGYAEYALLPNEQIYPVKTDLSWEILAALPETYFTAYGSLKNLLIREGDRVLIRGAASGVGVAFCRLLKGKWPSVHISGSCRNLNKEGKLREAGFDEIIEDRDNVLASDRTFDRVLELVGPASLKDTFRHMAEGGIVCSTGQLGGKWELDGLDPIMDLPANGYLTSFYSGNVSQEHLQEMLDYVKKYKVDPRPERVFSLQEVSKAHAYLESAESFGKVIVLV